jgi:hypothetical protein
MNLRYWWDIRRCHSSFLSANTTESKTEELLPPRIRPRTRTWPASRSRTTSHPYTARNWRPVPSGVYPPKALYTTFFGHLITPGVNWGAHRINAGSSQRNTLCLSGVNGIDDSMSRCPCMRLAWPWTDEFHRINPKYYNSCIHEQR